MPTTIKKPEEIELLREGGRRHAEILRKLAEKVAPGVTSQELDDMAQELIKEAGDTPAFLNYRPRGVKTPYPAALCVSVNDVVVHGIPNVNPVTLKEGDIVGLDLGVNHEGMITDAAITVKVGEISPEAEKLVAACKKALNLGIAAARGGMHIGDIGSAIEKVADEKGFFVADHLSGHGVGYKVHEDPFVPNFGNPGEGELLKPGMVLALEPIFNLGTHKVVFDKDEYTVHTKDGKISAHFEHTILITEKGAEILTE